MGKKQEQPSRLYLNSGNFSKMVKYSQSTKRNHCSSQIHLCPIKMIFQFIFFWVGCLPLSWRNGCNIAVLIYSLPRQLLLEAPHHNLQFSNSVIFLSNGARRPAKETDAIILGKVQNFKSHFATPAEVKGLNLVGECDRAWWSVLLVCNSLP